MIMTGPLSEGLNYCYSAMFSADMHARNGCHLKALMCYEQCRLKAMDCSSESIYLHCLFRAARKEAQLMIGLGLRRRAWRLLKGLILKYGTSWTSLDKLLVLAQLVDLSESYAPARMGHFRRLLEYDADLLAKERE
jgi:hypothetical protein